jgi:predicted sugar kinase
VVFRHESPENSRCSLELPGGLGFPLLEPHTHTHTHDSMIESKVVCAGAIKPLVLSRLRTAVDRHREAEYQRRNVYPDYPRHLGFGVGSSRRQDVVSVMACALERTLEARAHCNEEVHIFDTVYFLFPVTPWLQTVRLVWSLSFRRTKTA